MTRRPSLLRSRLVHAARLAMVAAIAGLVHLEHGRFVARQPAVELAAVPLDDLRAILPEVAAIGGDSPAVAGGRDLLDAFGDRVGTLLRTSPPGDEAIGFSGPTDLLVVCDADLCVRDLRILSSGDTRDHVAAIERDPTFLASFHGRTLAEIAELDPTTQPLPTVAGSTLTSLAITEALARRLGGRGAASRFAAAPTLADLGTIFPEAVRIDVDPGDPAVLRVVGAADIPLGWALRTSPAADRVIGYQGPTDTVVAFDAAGGVAGVLVLASYDNEPYVGYVRDDRAFRRLWRGMTVEQLAGIDPGMTGVEGVSGATMTSQAVAQGIVRAAREATATRDRGRPTGWRPTWAAVSRAAGSIDAPQWGALGVIAAGIATAFTRLRGTWVGRLALPVAVLAYLGFGAGALLSQAQLWGWAQAGVPRGATVLVVLAVAALMLPVATRRNVYCSHLCAHGAAQQLLVRWVRPRRSLPIAVRPLFAVLPWAVLALAILVAVLHLPVALVDLEPFDAYLPAVAGGAALAIFAVGLVASCFVPMAYCRHGCPTGALLDHLRFHRRADRLTWRDGVMLVCLAVAAAVSGWPRPHPPAGPASNSAVTPGVPAAPPGPDPRGS
jgi:NosR/NirI family nitrous oxide reductase transcriptional regulator